MRAPDYILPIPPHRSGIYHLVADGRVVYVGQSQNMLSRVASHDVINYTEARFFFCPVAELNDHEEAHIKALRPPYNAEGVTRPYRPRPLPHEGTKLINDVERLAWLRRELARTENKLAAHEAARRSAA